MRKSHQHQEVACLDIESGEYVFFLASGPVWKQTPFIWSRTDFPAVQAHTSCVELLQISSYEDSERDVHRRENGGWEGAFPFFVERAWTRVNPKVYSQQKRKGSIKKVTIKSLDGQSLVLCNYVKPNTSILVMITREENKDICLLDKLYFVRLYCIVGGIWKMGVFLPAD